MITFKKNSVGMPGGRHYGPCNGCNKDDNFHPYFIEIDPPVVCGQDEMWGDTFSVGCILLCEDCAKKLRLEINSLVW